ncbi:MAG: TadE/TadG family type IV pilus assembly protein [Anaerolineae bacterium]|nr:TadE/TadG family type IV pilus assembly protein [Anaerolineae bacterium]
MIRTSSRRRGRGQSLVEVALLLPVLIVLLAAVIDLGRVLDASIVLSNAARVGARFGSIHPTWYDSIRVRVVDFANNSGMAFTGVVLDGSNVEVSSSAVPGQPIVVTITYDLPLYFGRMVGLNTIRIVRRAEMMIMSSQ